MSYLLLDQLKRLIKTNPDAFWAELRADAEDQIGAPSSPMPSAEDVAGASVGDVVHVDLVGGLPRAVIGSLVTIDVNPPEEGVFISPIILDTAHEKAYAWVVNDYREISSFATPDPADLPRLQARLATTIDDAVNGAEVFPEWSATDAWGTPIPVVGTALEIDSENPERVNVLEAGVYAIDAQFSATGDPLAAIVGIFASLYVRDINGMVHSVDYRLHGQTDEQGYPLHMTRYLVPGQWIELGVLLAWIGEGIPWYLLADSTRISIQRIA